MPTIKNSNPKVSDAILKALGNDAKGRPQIAAAELKVIKATAARELRASEKPTTTLKEIKSSFELANRLTGNEYKVKFGELVTGELKDIAARRQQNLRQVDAGLWAATRSLAPATSRGSST